MAYHRFEEVRENFASALVIHRNTFNHNFRYYLIQNLFCCSNESWSHRPCFMLDESTEKTHTCLTSLPTFLHLVNSVSIRVQAVYSQNTFLILFVYYRPVSINQLSKIELTNKDQRKLRANHQHGLVIFFFIYFLLMILLLLLSFYTHKILIATPTSQTMCTKRLRRLSS